MSRVLADLLGTEKDLFAADLKRLEQASGQTSVDVRLSADIIAKSNQKIRELGLDPQDTTGRELYQALRELIKRHDNFIAVQIGAKDTASIGEILPKLQEFIQNLDLPRSVWVLKPTVAKQLLKASPPKKTMKQLGYRSLDSMLKRVPMGEVYMGIRLIESEAWQNNFLRKYQKLQPTDFETRDVQFVTPHGAKWQQLADEYVRQHRHNIVHLKELGAVVILPLPMKHLPGVAITMLSLILHYINELRVHSTYFKLQQMQPNFGHIVADTLLRDPDSHATMAGHDVHWRTIHHYFGRQDFLEHSEVFEPHVQVEDMRWQKTEETLYRVEPALHFWHDMDYVAVPKDGQIISFNLMDMAVSYTNRLPFGSQAIGHFRQSLWNELLTRYLSQPALENQVIKQFEPASTDEPFTTLNIEESFA